MVAEKTGVALSTIYRPWGDISELLADVALARMRSVADLEDTEGMGSDLEAFILRYAAEMSCDVGRTILSYILTSGRADARALCRQYTFRHLEALRERALTRGEIPFDVTEAMEQIVAPVVCHVPFVGKESTDDKCRAVVRRFLHPWEQEAAIVGVADVYGESDF